MVCQVHWIHSLYFFLKPGQFWGTLATRTVKTYVKYLNFLKWVNKYWGTTPFSPKFFRCNSISNFLQLQLQLFRCDSISKIDHVSQSQHLSKYNKEDLYNLLATWLLLETMSITYFYSREFRTLVKPLRAESSINNASNPTNLGAKLKLLFSRF